MVRFYYLINNAHLLQDELEALHPSIIAEKFPHAARRRRGDGRVEPSNNYWIAPNGRRALAGEELALGTSNSGYRSPFLREGPSVLKPSLMLSPAPFLARTSRPPRRSVLSTLLIFVCSKVDSEFKQSSA